MNSQSNAPDLIKQEDAGSYDANAGPFDRLTEIYSRSIAAHMIDVAQVGPADHVLDIGTGTGLVALQAAALTTSGRVVGIDHSTAMLDYATAKAEARGLADRASFVAMDAEALDLEDDVFDSVLSLFVLRHLPDAAAALREMRRVLKPGGRIVVSVGGRPTLLSAAGVEAGLRKLGDTWAIAAGKRGLAPAFLREILARHGISPTHNLAAGHHLADVAHLMREAGFAEVRKGWHGEAFDLAPDAFWDVQATFDSEARTMLDQCDVKIIESVKSEFMTRADAIAKSGGRLIYRTGALVYSGTKV